MNVIVSVVMLVHNAEKYLYDTLDRIINQTFDAMELVCVDLDSTDESLQILGEYADKDNRVSIVKYSDISSGSGLKPVIDGLRGEYIAFMSAEDRLNDRAIEKMHTAMSQTDADVMVSDYYYMDEQGEKKLAKGVRKNWIAYGKKEFSWQDCPDCIMSILDPVLCNKMYKKKFVADKLARIDCPPDYYGIAYAAAGAVHAGKILYTEATFADHRLLDSYEITDYAMMKFSDLIWMVDAVISEVTEAECIDHIRMAVVRFVVENYVRGYKRTVKCFDTENVMEYYKYIHGIFNGEEYVNVTASQLRDMHLWRVLDVIRRYDYDTMKKLVTRKLIVSLTSYPARIAGVADVVSSIWNQSCRPDEVVLWLAEDQFPGKDRDLPDRIRNMKDNNQITIRWCDDLKPHKKYFYALQEYNRDVVITIDDDVIYADNILENLWDSYVQYPEAVSATRAHIAVVDDDGRILPYNCWIKEESSCLYKPSMELFATGVGGVLYPPDLFKKEFFDKQAIMDTCLLADDIWLKAMEAMSGVPLVVAMPFKTLRFVPGSQEGGLYHQNEKSGQNDIQFSKVNAWIDSRYGKNALGLAIRGEDKHGGVSYVEYLCSVFAAERNNYNAKCRNLESTLEKTYHEKSDINARLQQTYRDKTEINEKLQTAYREKSELNEKLQTTYREKSELNAKLQATYREKSELNAKLQATYKEKSERGLQIKELKANIRAQKKEIAELKKTI